MTTQQLKEFKSKGYVIVKDAIDKTLVLNLKEAYKKLLFVSNEIYAKKNGLQPPTSKLSLTQLFVELLKRDCNLTTELIDPGHAGVSPYFEYYSDYPMPVFKEQFDLITNDRLISIISKLLGNQIICSPVIHLNLKTNPRVYEEIKASFSKITDSEKRQLFLDIYKFISGETRPHHDMASAFSTAYESNYINVWVPITMCNRENGTIVVQPKSHKIKHQHQHVNTNLKKSDGIAIELLPGDILIMDYWLIHWSLKNTSNPTRMAFNVRYSDHLAQPIRPFLPSFKINNDVGHISHETFKKWQFAWQNCLIYLNNNKTKFKNPLLYEMSQKEMEALNTFWVTNFNSLDDWINYNKQTTK